MRVVIAGLRDGEIERFCRANGYLAYADAGEGVWAFVCKMLWNHRVILGTFDSVLDAWCYEDYESAITSLEKWDHHKDPEPSGWKKHPSSGRYREGGDPLRESVSG